MTVESSTTGAMPGILRVALWVLKILVALAFAGAAFLKLSGNEKMVAEFAEIGLGQWFRYVTGALELGAAILLLVPRTAFLAALALMGICAGALVAQVVILHGDLVHVFVLGGLVALIAWLHRPR
jgi:putative oxidoreductase